jgi:chaperonin cofactor prefoldin
VLALQDTLSKKENEYSQLQEDYESYKARAHNLLQKMKNENNVKSKEEKLQKEVDTLSQTVRELKKRLDCTA